MSDSNPPVGATVVVPSPSGRSYPYTRRQQRFPDRVVWESNFGSVADAGFGLTLTLAWRLQQELREATDAAQMWMREARQRDATIAALVEEKDAALAARNVSQGNADDAQAELAALRAELVPLRALAVEAKEMVDDGTPSQAGLLRYETGDLHRFIERLAAHATPNQEPTP